MAYQFDTRYEPIYAPMITLERPAMEGAPPLLNQGFPVDPSEVATKGYLDSRHKRLPDLFNANGFLTVCDAFKRVVDELEPNVHQFFPITFFDKKGEVVPGNGPYFLLNVLHKFDAVFADRSSVEWIDLDPRNYPGVKTLHRGLGPWKLVMSRPQIAGRHLWLPIKMLSTERYCSNQIIEAVEKKKLKGFRHTPVEEIDEEWVPEGNVVSL